MNLSLISSQMSSDATSEKLLVREGAGDDEVFSLGHEFEGSS